MTSKTIRVSSLHPNPFRDYERNPPSQERIESLMDSIERNNLWRGIVVRPTPNGSGYQLAFGHHRLEAIKKLRDEYKGEKGVKNPYKSIDVDVSDLSDSQMLQHLSDENLNQGGKSPAAVLEIVMQSIFLLEGYLADSDTPEQFCELANIDRTASGGGTLWSTSEVWVRTKNSGIVGRDLLRAFLCPQHHASQSRWSNEDIQLGINRVKADRAFEQAQQEKEEARAEFEKKVGKVTQEEEEKLQARVKQAEADRKEAEKLKGYNEVIEMFPHIQHGTEFARELKNRYPDMPKSDQIRFANKLIQDGTGRRDIPRVLGELVKGKKAWEKEEKKRQKQKEAQAKKRKESWKQQWTKTHHMTPDQYIRENLGLFNQMNTFLDTLKEAYDYVEDDDLLADFTMACDQTREKMTAYVVGLQFFEEKEII